MRIVTILLVHNQTFKRSNETYTWFGLFLDELVVPSSICGVLLNK